MNCIFLISGLLQLVPNFTSRGPLRLTYWKKSSLVIFHDAKYSHILVHKTFVLKPFLKKYLVFNFSIQYFQIAFSCIYLTLSQETACQRHERSLTHKNSLSKSALIGFWVITVLSLECFVFRFACSVSKANNHSLFTVWVGLFFPFRRANYTQEWQLSEKERTNSLSMLW